MTRIVSVLVFLYGWIALGPAQSSDVIKIATLRVDASGPLYIAQERGYFADQIFRSSWYSWTSLK